MAHNSQFPIQLGDRGRLVLPSQVRRQLGLQAGDRLVLSVEPSGEMRLVSLRSQVARFHGLLKDISPERVLSEELIGERRQEALREEAE